MTIDDRLRDYADRWNAAAAPAPLPVVPTDDGDDAFSVPTAPAVRRVQPSRLRVAAVVAVLLVGATAVTGAVLAHRGHATVSAAEPDAPRHHPGTVDAATPHGSIIPPGQRDAAADVTGPLLAGGSWSLQSQRGRVAVLAAWGSWCLPCRDYAPALGALVRPGVTVTGFAVKENNALDARQFVASSGIDYPVVEDADAAVVKNLAASLDDGAMPVTFLVDRDGGIAAAYLGRCTLAQLDTAVDELLGE